MTRTSRAVATLAGAAAVIVAGMSPASAAYWRHDDAVGDVETQTITFDDETGEVTESDPTVDPANTDTDVTRLSVDHRTHRVVLKTTLRDLTATSGIVVYDIRTGSRRYSVMQRLGRDRMFPAFDISTARGGHVRCKGIVRGVHRDVNRAKVNIPRRCLGRPASVRVGAGVVKLDETDTSFSFHVDDALQEAMALDELATSPRVRRD